MLIVPKDIKGIRLYLGDPANFRFVAAHEEAATLTEELKVCLAKARLLQPDEMPRSSANEAWPADVGVFVENLGMKPENYKTAPSYPTADSHYRVSSPDLLSPLIMYWLSFSLGKNPPIKGASICSIPGMSFRIRSALYRARLVSPVSAQTAAWKTCSQKMFP